MTLEATHVSVRGSASRAYADDPRFSHNEAWWNSGQVREEPSAQYGTRVNYSFSDGEEEVARALVCAARAPLRGYELPTREGLISEIQFIEVRSDCQRQGCGLAVLSELSIRYPGGLVALALPDAEGFWQRTGWQHIQPDDDDGRSVAYLAR